MKNEGLYSLVLGKGMLSSKSDGGPYISPFKAVPLHLIFVLTAKENILIIETVVDLLPWDIMLCRIIKKSP